MFGSKNTPKALVSAVATPQAVWHPDQLPHIQELLAAIEKAKAPVDRENQRAQELAANIAKQSAQIADLEQIKKSMMARWVQDSSFMDDDQDSRDTEIAKCQRTLHDLTNKQKALISTRVDSEVDERLQEAEASYAAACGAANAERKAMHRERVATRLAESLLQSYEEMVSEGFIRPSSNGKDPMMPIAELFEYATRERALIYRVLRMWSKRYGEASPS